MISLRSKFTWILQKFIRLVKMIVFTIVDLKRIFKLIFHVNTLGE